MGGSRFDQGATMRGAQFQLSSSEERSESPSFFLPWGQNRSGCCSWSPFLRSALASTNLFFPLFSGDRLQIMFIVTIPSVDQA